MKPDRFGRPTLELLGLSAVAVVCLIVFHTAVSGDLFGQALIAGLGGTLLYTVRLPIGEGRVLQTMLGESLAAVVLGTVLGIAGLGVMVLVHQFEPALWIIGMALLMAGFVMSRSLRYGWRYWQHLRQNSLVWALTHAQLTMVLILFSLASGGLVVWLTLRMPSSQYPTLLLNLTLFALLPAVVMLLVLLPCFAVLSSISMRRTLRRLDKLVEATDSLRQGDYHARTAVEGADELARLQANFNAMAASLDNVVQQLHAERDSVSALLRLNREHTTSVSHELRTPTATLRAYLETMLDREHNGLPQQAQADLRIVADEAIHLQTLIEDLFTLARAEVDQLTLKHEPIDVTGTIRRMIDVMAPLAWQSYRIHLQADLPESSPAVLGDAQRLEQILRNLIQNGLQHTPVGGMVIVTLEQVFREGCEASIAITVEDTGEGIPAEDLPHIWDRFYRGQNHEDGTGLGLAVVKELAEAMQGSVQVQSTPGKGSRFTIQLRAE